MKKKQTVNTISLIVSIALILSIAMIATACRRNSPASGTVEEVMIHPCSDEAYVSRIVDSLGGGDALFHKGLNGIDIYEYLGYVYMGWRTTGGSWQNHVISEFVIVSAGTVLIDTLSRPRYSDPRGKRGEGKGAVYPSAGAPDRDQPGDDPKGMKSVGENRP